jgi:hypothetical protein
VNWQPEPFFEWWQAQVDLPQAQQRAERAEAEKKAAVARLREEQSSLEKAKRVLKSGVRMPWFNMYPVIGSEDR